MHKIKICGLRHPENIQELGRLEVDYLGFIFYPKSFRYVGEMDTKAFQEIPSSIQKVGVFVNEELVSIQTIARHYGLNFLQLHGEESPELCKELKRTGVGLIKAFQMDEAFDFTILENYTEFVDYFLFDTRSKQYGGSGKKFNWQVLERYQGNTPFFLSGGIGPGDEKAILEFQHPQLFALDLNSGFEDAPAYKNTRKLNDFIGGLTREKLVECRKEISRN